MLYSWEDLLPRGLPNFWAYTLKAIGGGTGLPGLLSPLQNLSIKTEYTTNPSVTNKYINFVKR